MSIIRVVYSIDTKEVVTIANESDGMTLISHADFGVIQGEASTIVEQAISMGIDALEILNFINQNNISLPYTMTPELRRVIKDRAFGQRVLNEFLSENKTMDLTLQQDLQLLQSFSPIKSMLEIGAINRAQQLWLQVPIDDIISQERYDKYSALLQEYLDANPL